jgi:hypothetical protein
MDPESQRFFEGAVFILGAAATAVLVVLCYVVWRAFQ